MTKETHQYQTEVQQLLDLVIHSLYSNKDIFLRELISNASDAIDKLKFDSLTNQDLIKDGGDWKIKVSFDKENKTITVSDNGIGMTRDEVIENIGTIAKSGTKQFLAELKAQDSASNPELIGQFGVGFYASFMVAGDVTLITKKAGDDTAVKWESKGDGSYTIEEADKDGRGTAIILNLNDDSAETYLNEWKLKEIIKKYSDFVEHPIVMDIEKEEGEEDKKEAKIVEETINSQKAIWTKSKNEITDEENKDFYKHISHDFADPIETIHYHAEGASEYKALLYIPSKAPMDLYYKDYKGGMNLYVKRVFIMHDCKKLVPEYFRFMKGVVDSSDLPLNVSREILQEDRNLEKIKKGLTKKILSSLKKMKEKETDKYENFYNEFGVVLKEGIHYDWENKDKIIDLLLFESTATKVGEKISLKEYKDNMGTDQKEIYFITGESRSDIENSPHLEAFKNKGYEVLFMLDSVDEFIIPNMTEYDGVKLQSVERSDLDLDENTKKEKETKEKEYKDVLDLIKDCLVEDIKDVKISTRLTDSASCLVAGADAMTKQMEQMMKAMGQEIPASKRILELNPSHAILTSMQKIYEQDKESEQLKDYSLLLYNQALLTEGSKVKDPKRFAKIVSDLMVKAAD